MNPNIQADIELIRSWAPLILKQGPDAELSDLKEVIRIRARLDATISNDLENNGAPFFLLMAADRVCAQLAHTLLYLPLEDAQEAAAEVGGHVNSLVWYGIHTWSMTLDVLDHWVDAINVSANDLEDVHRAEVSRAYASYEAYKGRDYINEAFFRDHGQWLASLNLADLEGLAQIIKRHRRGES
jgi:hypothetical protein